MEKLVQEDVFVVFKVVLDEGTIPLLSDLALYFLVEKKKYLSFHFIVNFFSVY